MGRRKICPICEKPIIIVKSMLPYIAFPNDIMNVSIPCGYQTNKSSKFCFRCNLIYKRQKERHFEAPETALIRVSKHWLEVLNEMDAKRYMNIRDDYVY